MARLARIVLPGTPHHAVIRVKPGQALFETDNDYRDFRDLLTQTAQRFGIEIRAACLLPDHVHLVVVPATTEALSRFIGEACRRFARMKGKPHLFQGRFRSCPLDPDHAAAAVTYVLQNPERLGLRKWPWTLGDCAAPKPLAPNLIDSIRSATRTGRPAGDTYFFAKVEYDLGRPVSPRKRGRKTKW
jgi:putative transposase